VFEYFGGPAKTTAVNTLQIQKYKSIIEKLTQQDMIKAAYEEDAGIMPTEDLEEDLELYINSKSID
jgi:hypothetical protein